MGTVIEFEAGAMATLRRRVAEVEEANQDLVAFARGHSGAVSAIHRAVLAMADAEGFDHLIHIVTHEWPDMLGLDAVAVALFAGVVRGHLAAGGAALLATHVDLGLPEAAVLDLAPFRARPDRARAGRPASFDEAFA